MNYIVVLVGAYLSLFGQVADRDLRVETHLERGPRLVSNDDNFIRTMWTYWKEAHNKTYDEDIDTLKRIIFSHNVKKVMDFNKHKAREAGFQLEPNHLADMSSLEMKQINGFRLPSQKNYNLDEPQPLENSPEAEAFLQRIFADNSTEVPDEVDWRKVPGRVSQVKNQGQCGSCWAFASTGVLEGQEANRKENLANRDSYEELYDGKDVVELSEQNLVDCVTKDYGCNGGYMADALDFVKEEGGIDDEKSYPYEARTKKCRFQKDKVAFTDAGSAILPTGDEQKLKEVVAKYGPVAVAIDASSIWFQLYRKGVYINKHCKNKQDQLDHGVLVVGYGTDPKKGDYWIVKNSWGGHYGENGYIRMARNRNNMCGIATVATIATF